MPISRFANKFGSAGASPPHIFPTDSHSAATKTKTTEEGEEKIRKNDLYEKTV
ncbi:MAG: hypothetical protein YYHSYBAR_002574, partial [Candidatus Fervidibacter sacchari]